jgi:hypothetical protein
MRYLKPTSTVTLGSGDTSKIYFNVDNGGVWIPQPTRETANFMYLQAPILALLLAQADHCGLWSEMETPQLNANVDAKTVAVRITPMGNNFKVHWFGDSNWGDSGVVTATLTNIPQVETQYFSLNTVLNHVDVIHNSAGYFVATDEEIAKYRGDLVFTDSSGRVTKTTTTTNTVKADSTQLANAQVVFKTVEFYNHMIIDHRDCTINRVYTVLDATQDPTVRIATGAVYVWFADKAEPTKLANLYDFTNPFIANWEEIIEGPNNQVSPDILPAASFDTMAEFKHFHPDWAKIAMDGMGIDPDGNLIVNGVPLSNGIGVSPGYENWAW